MNRSFKVAALVSALMLAVGFSAMASATVSPGPGRAVAVTQEIRDFLAARGVDPAVVGQAAASAPAAEWSRLLSVVNAADDTSITTDDHDVLNSMVLSALINATTTTDDPVYMDLGNNRWIYELDTDSD
jgi:hypothetical protein